MMYNKYVGGKRTVRDGVFYAVRPETVERGPTGVDKRLHAR
jgi:hypothetical protein